MATALEVRQPTVSEWLRGERQVPPRQCPKIERLTDGAVTCEMLRPDMEWAVLRSREARTPTPDRLREGDRRVKNRGRSARALPSPCSE